MLSNHSETLELVKPKESQVREQLARILIDEEFKRSPKISNFLSYIVDQTLKGKHQYIKAHSVAIDVFEKDENFDPQTDPIVRVNAVRLRRMLRHYYSSNNDEIVIDVIKGSYIPRFFYRDDEGISSATISEIVKSHSFPSIAVLNFKNLSNDLSHINYANGITHEIVSKLSRFKELVVIARSTINLSEDKLANAKRLNSLIDARYVLSGSVLIEGDTIRVNVELDDHVSHTNIWSHSYREEMNVKSIISIQDEIAVHVATTIAQPFGVIIRKELVELQYKSTDNLTAYELFLRYFQFYLTLSPKDHLIARNSLEKAVELDPQFSDAWAALAIIYASEYQLSLNQKPRDIDVRELAHQTSRRALKANPDNGRAHFAVFYTNLVKNNLNHCREDAEKALKLNPSNPLTLASYGLHLALAGEWEEGLEKIEYAIVMNPAHPDFYHFPFVLNYYRQNKYQEALREAQNIQMPDYFWTHFINTSIYSALNDAKLAQQSAQELLKLYPDIETKARFELEKWSMQPELVERLLNGLSQAGLNVS